MRRGLAVVAAGALLVAGVGRSDADIASTVHNLSVTGPGPLRAVSETRICVFCHTPHNARPATPLWNRADTGVNYVTYWSPSIDAYTEQDRPQPDGASRLCLSCHDGTIALGAVSSEPEAIPMLGGVGPMPPGSGASFGADLSGHHPISFRITQAIIDANNQHNSTLASLDAMRSGDPDVRLDANDKLQCTACHDPHEDGFAVAAGVHFWRKPTYSDVCLVCHLF